MTSCVVSFFFFVSLISSNTDATPTGVKVRITDRAKNVLKDLGLMYLKELLNKPFPDFSIKNGTITCTIKGLNLTELQVDPAQVNFSFQENLGLQFEIKDLNFAVELQREINLCFFKNTNIDRGMTTFSGAGVSATIRVRLNRNPQGGLNVEIPNVDCKIKADNIRTTSTGTLGAVWDIFRPVYQYFFNNKLCPALQSMINDKLKDLSMVKNLHEGRQLDLDYSLSSDIAVTSSSLDVSFKGLVSVQGQAVDTGLISPGKEPVFTDTLQMVYVGVSEFFFNGAAMSVYKSGPFQVPKLEGLKGMLVNGALKAVGLPLGPVKVELTEAPTIKISKAGLSAKVNVKAQSEAGGQVLLVTCQLDMKVDIKERRLVLVAKTPKCEAKSEKITGKILVRSAQIILYFMNKWFDEGVTIPLPLELSFFDGTIQYEDGYLVARGSLTFNTKQGSSRNSGR